MTKVHGKRYAYKFDFHGLMTACHQSQPHMPSPLPPPPPPSSPGQPQSAVPAAGPSPSVAAVHVIPSTSSSDFGGLYGQQHGTATSSPAGIFPAAPSYWATSAAGLSTLYQHPASGSRYPPWRADLGGFFFNLYIKTFFVYLNIIFFLCNLNIFVTVLVCVLTNTTVTGNCKNISFNIIQFCSCSARVQWELII